MPSDGSAATLPAGWERILDEIHARMGEALQAAEVPAEPAVAVPVPGRGQELEALCARLDQLHASAQQAEALVRQADLALEAAQLALEAQVTAGAGLRQRLAEWGGRAIG